MCGIQRMACAAKPRVMLKKVAPRDEMLGEINMGAHVVIPPKQPDPGQQRYKDAVLCLDGGGIRGLVTLILLDKIEKLSGKKITQMFDWIVGTSTGGILALALARGILISHFLITWGWSPPINASYYMCTHYYINVNVRTDIHKPLHWYDLHVCIVMISMI